MALHSNLKQGDMFGRYRLEEFLGAGGFAVVWKALDTLTNAVVALKIFSSLDDVSIQDLAAEYAQVHNLSHPNIIRAEHFDSLDNIPYLVMKYCSGGNLEHSAGHMSQEQVLEMIRQITEALSYLHAQGLVHQDIKPANILTEQTSTGTRYMLSDFGISAKSRTRLSKSVADGAQAGMYLTYAYAPPEKFSSYRKDRIPHRMGDIFSLGITAYELATGHLPLDDLDTGRELQYNPQLQLDFSEITIPPLRNIIHSCLQANQASRPEPADILKWINYHKNSPKPNPVPPKPHPKPRKVIISEPEKPQKDHNAVGWAIVISALVIVTIIIIVGLDNHNSYNQYYSDYDSVAVDSVAVDSVEVYEAPAEEYPDSTAEEYLDVATKEAPSPAEEYPDSPAEEYLDVATTEEAPSPAEEQR